MMMMADFTPWAAHWHSQTTYPSIFFFCLGDLPPKKSESVLGVMASISLFTT